MNYYDKKASHDRFDYCLKMCKNGNDQCCMDDCYPDNVDLKMKPNLLNDLYYSDQFYEKQERYFTSWKKMSDFCVSGQNDTIGRGQPAILFLGTYRKISKNCFCCQVAALCPFWANKGSFDFFRQDECRELLFAQKGHNAAT